MRHYSAPDSDCSRRGGTNDDVAQLGKRPGYAIPTPGVGLKLVDVTRRDSRLDRRTCGKPLHTCSVERACADPLLAGTLDHPHMSKLGMQESPRRHAIDDETDPYPSADGDVGKISHLLPRAPTHLGDCCAVDIGIDQD